MPAGQPVHSAGRAATEPRALRWGALQIALAIVVLLQVWRIHDLFPVLAVHGVPILATVTAVALFALSNDVWRRVSSLNHPIVRAALGIVLLVALSVPGSLYPGASASFLLKDYLRSVILMVLVAASIRGLSDVRRFAWLQLAGVTLLSAVVVARAQMGADGRLRDVAYYDVNDLALLIVCTLPLVLYLWRKPAGPWSRALLAAATVFLMVALGKTGSRGGFLGLVTVGGYLLLRLRATEASHRDRVREALFGDRAPDGPALRVVRLEQRRCGPAAEHARELPRQVLHVLHAGVEP